MNELLDTVLLVRNGEFHLRLSGPLLDYELNEVTLPLAEAALRGWEFAFQSVTAKSDNDRKDRYDDMRRVALKALLTVHPQNKGVSLFEQFVLKDLRLMIAFTGQMGPPAPIGYASFIAEVTEDTADLLVVIANHYRRLLELEQVPLTTT